MSDSLRHPLLQAAILSLALHAALLLNVVNWLPARMEMPAAPISAVLSNRVSAKPLEMSAAKPVPSPSSTHLPLSAKPLPETKALSSFPARSLVVPGAALQAVPEPSSRPDDALRPPSLRPDNASANVSTSRAGTVLPSALPSSNQGVSADDLRQYRLSLAIAARHFKRYPALARERGWEGTAEVAINLVAMLPTPQISLLSSSGRPVLDEQALDMIAQAARSTTLPENLKGRDFRVLLPVKFSLEDEN